MLIINLLLYTLFFYGSVNRRTIKRKLCIIGLVQDHHIIPYEHRDHIRNSKILTSIHDSKNIIMLPNTVGKCIINTTRPIHENGHKHYNKYVKLLLDEYNIDEVHDFLRSQLINNKNKINKLI